MSSPYSISGGPFDGLTRATGLFNPAVEESNDETREEFQNARKQCFVRSIDVEVTGAPVTLEIFRSNPDGGDTLWRRVTLTESASYGGGAGGLMTLPTNPNRKPWRLKFVTDNPSNIEVDFDNDFTQG